jgi:signal transduction histidine kinase
MPETSGPPANELGLAFFGAISASVSHDLNNVIGIINELSGLVEDYLAGAQGGTPVNLEKMNSINEKIKAQVGRGQKIIKRFNRFSHSADQPLRTVDLKMLLQDITDLARRKAGLKYAVLKAELPDETVNMETSPFYLQFAVFLCIELALCRAKKDDRITVTFRPCPGGAQILISGPGQVPDDPEAASKLAVIMQALKGRSEFTAESIVLSVPVSPSQPLTPE